MSWEPREQRTSNSTPPYLPCKHCEPSGHVVRVSRGYLNYSGCVGVNEVNTDFDFDFDEKICPLYARPITDLKASYCSSLIKVHASNTLTNLILNDCIGLISLKDIEFPNLEHLTIEDCFKLESVNHSYPKLSNFYASKCSNLLMMPADLPKIRTININECESLKYLPAYKTLVRLDADDCINLEWLSPLIQLGHLSVKRCVSLIELPALPRLTYLNMDDCVSIERLSPDMMNLSYMRGQNAISLTHLTTYPQLHGFDLEGAVSIMRIETQPICNSFNITGCLSLTFIGKLSPHAETTSDPNCVLSYSPLLYISYQRSVYWGVRRNKNLVISRNFIRKLKKKYYTRVVDEMYCFICPDDIVASIVEYIY